MRRTILLVTGAVLAGMLVPGRGIGQPTVSSSHGGTPSDVFMSSTPDVCNETLRARPVNLLPTAVSVGEQSHLLAYFTATWNAEHALPELLLGFRTDGADSFSESSTEWIAQGGGGGHYTGTVIWTFDDIAPGDYTVQATARLGGPKTGGRRWALQNCALSVFVIPVAP